MGLRIDDMLNNSISNAIDSLTETKVNKKDKAFAAFLDNAARSNVTSADYPVSDASTVKESGISQSDSSDESKLTDKNNEVKADVKAKDSSKVEEKNAVEEIEDVSQDEAVIVLQIEEAIMDVVSKQLGITIEEVDNVLNELDMSAVDLLQKDNLLEFVMQVNGIDDVSVVLTDESLMNQVKELVDELDFVVENVAKEHGITVEELPEIVENVSTFVEKTSVEDRSLNDNQVLNNAEELSESTDKTQQVVVESDKSDNTDNNRFDSEDSNMFMDSNSVRQNPVTQITEALSQTQTTYTSVDMEEIVNQIVEQIKVQVTEESTSMEMQLNPENYGKLQLHVALKEGVVTAQMAVENEAVKNALESQVVLLKEQMNNQGVKVEAIEVTIASHEFESNLQQEDNAAQEAFEQEQAKATRQRMNLNLTTEDLLSEDIENMSSAEVLQRKMMLESGNRMNIQA